MLDPLIDLLNEWKQLQKSGAVNDLFRIFSDHKDYLEKEALTAVDKADFHLAVQYAAQAKDMDKIIKLILSRVLEIKGKVSNG